MNYDASGGKMRDRAIPVDLDYVEYMLRSTLANAANAWWLLSVTVVVVFVIIGVAVSAVREIEVRTISSGARISTAGNEPSRLLGNPLIVAQ